MPTITSATNFNADPQKVYDLVKNFAVFPRFIAGIESIHVIGKTDKASVSKWRINIDGTVLTWEEQEHYDHENLRIEFKMISGDFAQYQGVWIISSHGDLTQLELIVTIDWNIQNLRDQLIRSLEKKTKLALRWMLRSLQKQMGVETIQRSEGVLQIEAQPIISELITYHNREGRKIVGYYDHKKGITIDRPFIVIPTGYGETKRDALSTSYYLARNDFNVVRYDNTDHVGESDGEMVNTTLSKMMHDLFSTIDYVQQAYGTGNVGVVASSLSNRVAIKAASEDKRIGCLVGVVGVVDVRSTLYAVYKEDMVGAFLKGEKWGVTDVLGCEVSFENFIGSAVEGNFHDITTTIEDVKNIDVPIVLLMAENDAWVRMDQVKVVLEHACALHEFHVVPEAMHQLQENPKAVKTSLRQIVVSCKKYMAHESITHEHIIEPSLKEIAVQNKIEKGRLKRLIKITKETEKDFWSEYLQKYFVMVKSDDYRHYLSFMEDLMGGIRNNDACLDAGCGNGHLSAWLLHNLLRKVHDTKRYDFNYSYSGLDVTAGAIAEAEAKVGSLEQELSREYALEQYRGKSLNYSFSYMIHDLDNNPLPFKNAVFNKIICSLVLSYIDHPVECIHEFYRMLQPKGIAIVTSLKPYNDLSVVYKKFVDKATTEEELVEGRRLLSSAGRIKMKENFGYYKFYEEQEFVALMLEAGFKNVRCYRAFGDQVNVVIGEKK